MWYKGRSIIPSFFTFDEVTISGLRCLPVLLCCAALNVVGNVSLRNCALFGTSVPDLYLWAGTVPAAERTGHISSTCEQNQLI
jgi:hypothetical protein